MDSTNSTERDRAGWQKAREVLDRLEASGLLDGAPITSATFFGSGGLGLHIDDREHAERIATQFEMGKPTVHICDRGASLRWRGEVDGVHVDLFGIEPIDIKALMGTVA